MQFVEMDLFLHVIWSDWRLSGRVNNKIVVDPRWYPELWTPEVFFKNSADGRLDKVIFPYAYITLEPSGQFFLAARVSLKLACNMDLSRFPPRQSVLRHATQQPGAPQGAGDALLEEFPSHKEPVPVAVHGSLRRSRRLHEVIRRRHVQLPVRPHRDASSRRLLPDQQVRAQHYHCVHVVRRFLDALRGAAGPRHAQRHLASQLGDRSVPGAHAGRLVRGRHERVDDHKHSVRVPGSRRDGAHRGLHREAQEGSRPVAPACAHRLGLQDSLSRRFPGALTHLLGRLRPGLSLLRRR
ncbi:hypothetical protein MRX96_057593 [Rhipicephalus microplus]